MAKCIVFWNTSQLKKALSWPTQYPSCSLESVDERVSSYLATEEQMGKGGSRRDQERRSCLDNRQAYSSLQLSFGLSWRTVQSWWSDSKIVSAALIKTSTGSYKRPVKKLIPVNSDRKWCYFWKMTKIWASYVAVRTCSIMVF